MTQLASAPRPDANTLTPSTHRVVERPLTTGQLAAHFSVCPRTIQNWRDRGLPHRRVNARVFRYHLPEVEAFFTHRN